MNSPAKRKLQPANKVLVDEGEEGYSHNTEESGDAGSRVVAVEELTDAIFIFISVIIGIIDAVIVRVGTSSVVSVNIIDVIIAQVVAGSEAIAAVVVIAIAPVVIIEITIVHAIVDRSLAINEVVVVIVAVSRCNKGEEGKKGNSHDTKEGGDAGSRVVAVEELTDAVFILISVIIGIIDAVIVVVGTSSVVSVNIIDVIIAQVVAGAEAVAGIVIVAITPVVIIEVSIVHAVID